jgi:hypothetical protein
MSRWKPQQRWLAVVVATTVVALGGTAVAWVRRTAPPWPSVEGTPFEIALGPDGCPVRSEDFYPYVEAPGDLVPPGATEITLCIKTTVLSGWVPVVVEPAGQRVLRAGAAEFAAWLNRLPDRNTTWRRMQREDSGWWPDEAPSLGEMCALAAVYPQEDYSFVLRYADRPPVPLILTCAGALTSGARSRMDFFEPYAVDEFERRFRTQ